MTVNRTLAAAVMSALLVLATAALPAPARAATREYWVAAVPTTWNVVPSGRDPLADAHGTMPDEHGEMPEPITPGSTTLRTVVYRLYTRGWKRPMPPRPGIYPDAARIPGPLLRARVGDRLLVHFKNLDFAFKRPHSMHFHGAHYRPGSDGAYVPGFSGPGADVKPGGTFTYVLDAGGDAAGVWPYHDHSPSMTESIAGGMYGALSILPRHKRWPDREYVVFLGRLAGYDTIDGRAFLGNTPIFHARVGERVRWDVLTLGDEFHTFHIHGHRWLGAGGVPIDTRSLGPAESFAVEFREDAPGTWLYHCHVESHMMHGMIGLYRVRR